MRVPVLKLEFFVLMSTSAYVVYAVFVPLLGAIPLPVCGRFSAKLRHLLAFCAILCPLVLAARMIPIVAHSGPLSVTVTFPFGFNFGFYADILALFMAGTSSLISLIIILYSIDYISHYQNQNEYYFLVVLFLGSMMGIIFSSNLICLYIFWELTAITSWRLIGFYRERTDVLRADKAFLVTAFGAVVMLLGFIHLYLSTGSFDLAVIQKSAAIHPLPTLALALILFGVFSKSAVLPFHTWLPDAGVAPSPVTALLHAAVLVKIGVYVYARLLVSGFYTSELWCTIVPWIAGTSAIVSAGAALLDTDLKRILAYSTVSQIGFIFLGLGCGTPLGFTAGLLYILAHGLAKAGLFLCAGIIEQNTHTKDITQLGGLIKTMPLTALAFACCAFSVMGLPPFGGFFSKFLIFFGALQAGQIGTSLFFLCGAFLTIMYLLRLFYLIFLGDLKINAAEGSPVMVGSVVLFAVLSAASGCMVWYPLQLARLAACAYNGVY